MVLFNHATREITAKIVYYGPGLCGKTTNLMVIFDKLDPKQKGKMLSLATKTDRTLFFDLLPVDIGKVGNFILKIQLYTVPGQVFYNETRKLVLRGADAVVFVADSQPSMIESNRESFGNLMENLRENQIDPNDTPIVVQFNKRDIPGVLPVEDLQRQLELEGYPATEAAALKAKVAEPEPEPEALGSPFADTPFPEEPPFPEPGPLNAGYEKMEEVSLEQLLEGRERPTTLGGSVPVPMEEIEELGTEELVPHEEPVATAVMDAPFSPAPDTSPVDAQVRELQQQLEALKTQQRMALENLARDLEDLAARVRSRLR
jgi:signal recognition particle receptor subunit beta